MDKLSKYQQDDWFYLNYLIFFQYLYIKSLRKELCSRSASMFNSTDGPSVLCEQGVMQGTIPYLGTFLTDLVMMDTAMKDYTEVRHLTCVFTLIALNTFQN